MIELTPADIEYITSVVLHAARYLPPQFNRADLVQQGIVAALQSALAYDARQANGASFRTFARYRIRGAVFMAARRRNWVEAWHTPIDALHQWVVCDAIADSTGEELEPNKLNLFALQDLAPSPLEQFSQSQLRAQIVRAIDELPNPERFVFKRRQLDGVTSCRVAKQAHWPVVRVREVEASARFMLRQVLTMRGITPETVCLA